MFGNSLSFLGIEHHRHACMLKVEHSRVCFDIVLQM